MSYFSIEFVVFIIVTLGLLGIISDAGRQNMGLLIASYFFYGWSDIRFLGLLFAMSVCTWYLGERISHSNRKEDQKRYLAVGLIICLLTLGLFKYLNFFIDAFAKIFRFNSVTLNLVLPLGLSFYTFQAISYLVDTYTGKISFTCKLSEVLLYIGFFPQIVAGPIIKARDFIPQIRQHKVVVRSRIFYGLQMVLIGILKKKVIADRLAVAVNSVYEAPDIYSGLSLLVISVGYAIQIYCDFSGYSDMAIGIAYMLGFDFGKNFDRPYVAKNASDFWKRWHISLSSWFREYVYIPFGGNRKGRLRTYLNLFITMLLSGFWHGANWTFIIWGALHGVYAIISSALSRKNQGTHRILLCAVINTMIVWFLWIPFRAPDIHTAWVIVYRIFTMASGITYISIYSLVYAAVIVGCSVALEIAYTRHNFTGQLDLTQFRYKVLFCVLVLVVVCFSYIGESAFIYAQF